MLMKTQGRILVLILMAGALFCPSAQAQYNCVEGDCINGRGKKVIEDGSGFLEGDFWRGELVSGKVAFPNGDVFEGQFKGTDLIRGVKHFKNGTIHEGKFYGTILTEGKVTYPDGSTYDIHMKKQKEPLHSPAFPIPHQ